MGDKIGRDKFVQKGHHNSIVVTSSSKGVDDAAAELTAFIDMVRAKGIVGADGAVHDPAKLASEVRKDPDRLSAVRKALTSGAGDALLKVVNSGVAELITALVGSST